MALKLLMLMELKVFVPIPNVSHRTFTTSVRSNDLNKFINFLSVFINNNLSTLNVFTLKVLPFVGTSVVVRLLATTLPTLRSLRGGRNRTNQQGVSRVAHCMTLN